MPFEKVRLAPVKVSGDASIGDGAADLREEDPLAAELPLR
jgi:hypothetical protein